MAPRTVKKPLFLLFLFLSSVHAQTSLTEAGCCTGAFWGPDSEAVFYFDRVGDALGLYRVGLEGNAPELFTPTVGDYSPDLRLVARPDGDAVQITNLSGEAVARLEGATRASFSPENRYVLWSQRDTSGPFDARAANLFVGPLGEATAWVAGTYGGGFAGWLDDARFLVVGKPSAEADYRQLYTVDIPTGETRELMRMTEPGRISGVAPSPGGDWVAYSVLFDPAGERNGLWLVRAGGEDNQKLEPYGSYRWRDSEHLLVIPLEPGEPRRLLEVAVETGETRELEVPPLDIANGEWSVSPDGSRLLFLSNEDENLQVVTLP